MKVAAVSRRFGFARVFAPLMGLMALAAAPAGNPAVGRFNVAGVMIGMSLDQAVAEMRQTFAMEGLVDVHPMTAHGHPAVGGAMLLLAVSQSASTSSAGPRNYREDRFKLRLAGPPAHPLVVEVSRDYLAPVGLSRAVVMHNLLAKYGTPTSSSVPDASIDPNSALLTWLVGTSGVTGGAGPQYSAELTCGAALSSFDDYFDNAAGDISGLVDALHQQRADRCGLVAQISFAYDAVHYQIYDTGTAMQQLAGVRVAHAVTGKALVSAAGLRAAADIRY